MSTAIDHLLNGNASDFNNEIDAILKTRIGDAIAARKVEVAKTFISDPEDEVYEEEDDNEDVS